MLVKQSPVIPEFWAQETILFNGDKPHCLFFTDCAGFLRASVRALKQPHVVYQCDSGSGKICVAPQHLPMILWIPENDVPQHEYIALHGNVVEYLSDVPPIALFEEFSIEDSGPIWIVTAELIISINQQFYVKSTSWKNMAIQDDPSTGKAWFLFTAKFFVGPPEKLWILEESHDHV